MLRRIEANIQKSTPYNDKVCYIRTINDQKLCRSADPEVFAKITSKIKSFLDDKSHHYEGLLFLQTVVSQCDEEFVQQYAREWIQNIMLILENPSGSSSAEVSCDVLRLIFEKILQPCEVGDKFMPQIVAFIISTGPEDQWIVSVLKLLATLLQKMPSHCLLYKGSIEKFLADQLDCTLLSEVLADCYSHLPLLTERSQNESNYQICWLGTMKCIIGSMSYILNFLYTDLIDYEVVPTSFGLPLGPEPEEEGSAIVYNCHRFQTLALCLTKMLCTKTKHCVQVPMGELLTLIDQILMFPKSNDQNKSKLKVFVLLPNLYTSALVILEALITSCSEHLVENEAAVSKILLFISKIHANGDGNTSNESCCSQLHSTVYRVMQLYVEKIQPSTATLKNFIPKLFPELLQVILPVNENQDVPCISKNDLGNCNLRKEPNVCESALNLLSSLLLNTRCCIEPPQFKSMLKQLADCLFIMLHEESPWYPYNNDKLRKKLYKVLLHMSTYSRSIIPSPSPYVISILQNGQKDSSLKVSRFCCEAAFMLNPILYPEKMLQLPDPNVKSVDEATLNYSVVEDTKLVISNIGTVKQSTSATVPIIPTAPMAVNSTPQPMMNGNPITYSTSDIDLSSGKEDCDNEGEDEDDEGLEEEEDLAEEEEEEEAHDAGMLRGGHQNENDADDSFEEDEEDEEYDPEFGDQGEEEEDDDDDGEIIDQYINNGNPRYNDVANEQFENDVEPNVNELRDFTAANPGSPLWRRRPRENGYNTADDMGEDSSETVPLKIKRRRVSDNLSSSPILHLEVIEAADDQAGTGVQTEVQENSNSSEPLKVGAMLGDFNPLSPDKS